MACPVQTPAGWSSVMGRNVVRGSTLLSVFSDAGPTIGTDVTGSMVRRPPRPTVGPGCERPEPNRPRVAVAAHRSPSGAAPRSRSCEGRVANVDPVNRVAVGLSVTEPTRTFSCSR